MKYITIVIFGTLAGEVSAAVLLPYAAAQRGGAWAIGGEWLLIIIAIIAGAKIGHIIYSTTSNSVPNKRRKGGSNDG